MNNEDKVDSEERYVGDYDISRHVLMTGVSKYNTPHLVTKVGHLKNEWVNRVNGTVADYVITLTNDGSKSLAPLYVTDRFPGWNDMSALRISRHQSRQRRRTGPSSIWELAAA